MKKMLIGMAFMGLFQDTLSQSPFHIARTEFVTGNCQVAQPTATTLAFSVDGGTAPYTLSATNVNQPNQSSTNGSFSVITQTNPLLPVTVTIRDAEGTEIEETYDLKPSLFAIVDVTSTCPGTLLYEVKSLRGVGIDVKATLTKSRGLSEAQIGVTGTFIELEPGEYTLTLTPTGNIPANCNVSLVIPITLVALPFAVTATNTALAGGSNEGALTVTAIEGIPAFIFSITGPVTQQVGPQTSPEAKFENLPGGIYTVTVSDNNAFATGGCEVTTQAIVNFFSNPVANRLALGYCQ